MQQDEADRVERLASKCVEMVTQLADARQTIASHEARIAQLEAAPNVTPNMSAVDAALAAVEAALAPKSADTLADADTLTSTSPMAAALVSLTGGTDVNGNALPST